ncbi:CRISPR-associated endonuclease Cas3'' [Lichenifustis flavocetrariae]|uniref:CRISPR-associated endonuclease Cas3 n=1 Tax=Lichenifustis flavocetrariae TaxID=2949735 RepID=A0AA41Z234_9HYPH|nr:CRISPR-associated endonuclease Cas3'' [Lichenifustis flavocetrariae]MCW6512309.1 CRISPR-associated endonuclease Cas3'' [Lichenifustis flavocetrariae]
MTAVFAHSVPHLPQTCWETLAEHAVAVAESSEMRASPIGVAPLARAAGMLHDIGKCSTAFRTYIESDTGQGPDHSTAGAVEALRLYPGPIGRMLAFVIAGHHAGLADGPDLGIRLEKNLPTYAGWEAEVGPLPPAGVCGARLRGSSPHRGFSLAFLIRMLFSCLVDADFVETERFYAKVAGQHVEREGFTPLPVLHERLQRFMAAMRASAEATAVNTLRATILDHAIGKAPLAPGLFTLTVPTGGGKTLVSLSFALEHARRHELRRVIYVIPFTSVIEQVASVFRSALALEPGGENQDDILEHHANFDWEAATRLAVEDGRGSDPADRLRRGAENWEAPVVVTTAVQFFESLFANRTSRCRKLHNLAKSVIVLDEAQTLPLPLLRPCLAALDELQRNYGASVVLCTATQPALRVQDGFDKAKPGHVSSALNIPSDRELAPDPEGLAARLKRVAIERLEQPITDAEIAARFAAQVQMLCIVNSRGHAQALFGAIRELPGAMHLSTLMCPAHRRIVLAEARRRLKAGAPVRIVSTSLIEAGVDIDLPEVWRAAAGLDSIAQAAGRCNREGKRKELGRVVVFEPAEAVLSPEFEHAWQAARAVLRGSGDPLAPAAIRSYFGEVYWQKGPEALDAARLEGETYPILQKIAERAPQNGEKDPLLAFPFASIGQAFRVIEEVMEPVIVPWRAAPGDDTCETILRRVAAMDKPLGPDLRRLQRYVVAIPRKVRSEWLALGVLRPVHPALGDALLRFEGLEHYDEDTGVRLRAPLERGVWSNVL